MKRVISPIIYIETSAIRIQEIQMYTTSLSLSELAYQD